MLHLLVSLAVIAVLPGLCEELVYRGFAINALKSRGLNRWLAVVAASLIAVRGYLRSVIQRPPLPE